MESMLPTDTQIQTLVFISTPLAFSEAASSGFPAENSPNAQPQGFSRNLWLQHVLKMAHP